MRTIVGYSTFTAKPSVWALCSAQFQGTDGNDAKMTDLISGDFKAVELDDYDQYLTTAPNILIQKGTDQVGYNAYYYCYMGEKGVDYEEFWFDLQTSDYAVNTVAPGTGIWFKHEGAEDATVTFAGQVLSLDAKPFADCYADTWALISNPFPTGLTFAECTFDGIVAVELDDYDQYLTTAPNILVPKALDTVGYDSFYYCYMGAKGVDYEEFWFDLQTSDYAANTIPVGYGFWFKAATDVTISFKK